jgi:hypothetical protein
MHGLHGTVLLYILVGPMEWVPLLVGPINESTSSSACGVAALKRLGGPFDANRRSEAVSASFGEMRKSGPSNYTIGRWRAQNRCGGL